jgi:hypothetical protein
VEEHYVQYQQKTVKEYFVYLYVETVTAKSSLKS